jgi:hypothetical protein
MACLTALMTQGGTNCFDSPSLLQFWIQTLLLCNVVLHPDGRTAAYLGSREIFWNGTRNRFPDYDGVNGAIFTAACSSGLPH